MFKQGVDRCYEDVLTNNQNMVFFLILSSLSMMTKQFVYHKYAALLLYLPGDVEKK